MRKLEVGVLIVFVRQVSDHARAYQVCVIPSHVYVDVLDEGLIPRRVVSDHQLESVGLWKSTWAITNVILNKA